jgi:hypothetical protein
MITSLLWPWILFLLGVTASQQPFEGDRTVLPLSRIDDEPQDYHHHTLTTAMDLVENIQRTILEQSQILSLQTPEEVCEQFNNQTIGFLTCKCSRFGTRETQLNCTYDVPQCNSDNSTCYTGSVSQVLNEEYKARVVTSCTTFTQSVTETPNAETCIRVFPVVNGEFGTIKSCSATLQPTGTSAANVCASCSICASDNTSMSSRSNSTANPRISVNCCNVQTDAIQTCGPVDGRSGSALPQFDIILPENKGMCTSDGGVAAVRFSRVAGTTMMLLWIALLAW